MMLSILLGALLFIGAILVLGAATGLLMFIRAAVVVILWGWFIVPAFGLPAIGYATALGMEFIVHLLTPKQLRKVPEAEEPDMGMLVGYSLAPLFYLLLGWIVKLIAGI